MPTILRSGISYVRGWPGKPGPRRGISPAGIGIGEGPLIETTREFKVEFDGKIRGSDTGFSFGIGE